MTAAIEEPRPAGNGRAPNARALVAAAQLLDPRDRLTAAKLKKNAQEWQRYAWDYDETLAPIHFAHDYYANVISRVRTYAGYQVDPDEPPIPLDDLDESDAELPEGLDVNLSRAAVEEMNRLDDGAEGGLGGVMGDFGLNIGLVGEGFLVGRDVDDGEGGLVERFEVFSTEQFKATGEGYRLHLEGDQTGTPLDPNAFVLRIYRRHRRWREKADAPMRALLDDCDNLLLLKRVLRAVSSSRIHGGILKVPSELMFPQRATDPTEQGQAADTPLMEQLQRALITPIQDPSSVNSVVPMEVTGPAAFLKEFTWLDLGRGYSTEILKDIDQLTKNIAIGLDLPNEIVVGMSDANHWTAWEISSQTFKSHIEPLVQLICRGLTEGYLWPALRGRGLDPRNVVVWYDPTALIGHDNLFGNMTTMHQSYAVSDAALRRAGGANDDDAPDEEEIKRRIFVAQQLRVTIRETGIAPAGVLQPESDLANAGNPSPPGTTPPGAADKGQPAVTPADQARPGLAASAGPRADLGRRMMEIDRDLRLQVQTLADQALHRALERAGGRIRSHAAKNDRKLHAHMAEIPSSALGRFVGADVVKAWGLAEHELIDGEMDELDRQYRRRTKRAMAAALVAGRAGDRERLTDDDVNRTTRGADGPITAGFAILSAAVLASAHDRLFSDGPLPPPVGELDTEATVPIGVVRDSLAIAGGQTAIAAESAPAGVAVGPLVLDALKDALDIFPSGWQWVYGYPDRPFEPHFNLEGVEFSSWDDDQLANDEGWPATDFFYPGDHLGCECSYIPMFSSDRAAGETDLEAPPEEEA